MSTHSLFDLATIASRSTLHWVAAWKQVVFLRMRQASSTRLGATSLFLNAPAQIHFKQSILNVSSAFNWLINANISVSLSSRLELSYADSPLIMTGTDSAGTGAPEIVSNIRSICSFASSLLGHAQSANYPTYNFTYTPSVVPSYTDVTSQWVFHLVSLWFYWDRPGFERGPGYLDQATGAIFSSSAKQSTVFLRPYTTTSLLTCLALCLAPLFML